MCRLLGAVGACDASLLQRLRQQAVKHKDGWGLAWWGPTAAAWFRRSCSAAQDPVFDAALSLALASGLADARSVLVAHIRTASRGAVEVRNTQPFLEDGWAFAHNGTIHGIGGEESSDSLLYFRAVLKHLRAKLRPPDALRKAAGEMAESRSPAKGNAYSSLNCILSDGRRLYAVEQWTENPADDPHYYAIYWQPTASGAVIASSGVAEAGWQRLGPGCILAVDGDGARVLEL